MWKIYKEESSDLGFAIGCLFSEAINLNEFRQWVELCINDLNQDEIPLYMFDLIDFEDSLAKIHLVIGFVPSSGLSKTEKIEVIREAIGLGMNILVYDKFPATRDIELEFFDGQKLKFTITSVDFDEVITKADFISLHVPAQDGYIFGEKEFAKMKDGVIVINTARGGVVDERALVDAIEDGKVAGAALDVFENEPTPEMGLLMNESLSLSPHIAGSTNEAQDRIGTELASQIVEIYGK